MRISVRRPRRGCAGAGVAASSRTAVAQTSGPGRSPGITSGTRRVATAWLLLRHRPSCNASARRRGSGCVGAPTRKCRKSASGCVGAPTREIAPDSMISTRGATDVGQARFCAVRHEFRLELTDGGDVFWELAHPSLLLTRMVEECPSLQEVFAAAFRRREPTAEAPWGLLIGWDENVPGSKLALQQSGKSMNMSFSFLELGRHALYHEACWFTPVVVQTKLINRVAGGWSRMLKDFLRLLLLSDGGFERGGVPIKINGSYSLVYARVRRALSDGACEYAYACMYFFIYIYRP